MAKLTMAFGVVLMLVSLCFWIALGHETAALHPGGVGVVLLICGVLANTENPKKRMLWMHIAVTIGLIGFLITGIRAVIELAKGTAFTEKPLGFDERALVAVICGVFVAICVRSFIAARRTRLAA